MNRDILGRYAATANGDGIRIDLGGWRNVLCTSMESGTATIGSIGIGTSDCDLDLPGAPGLGASVSELDYGPTRCAAVAVADLGGGAARAGCEDAGGRSSASVIVLIDADMPVSSMARAMVTATEAVTAVIQDLGLRDSAGRCGTGTASFSMTVVTDPDSGLHLRNAGKHSKLGELIGRTVYDAVMGSAIGNGIRRDTAEDIIIALENKKELWEIIASATGIDGKDPSMIGKLLSDPAVSAGMSAIIHLDDEIEWGLVPKDDGSEMEKRMVASVFGPDMG